MCTPALAAPRRACPRAIPGLVAASLVISRGQVKQLKPNDRDAIAKFNGANGVQASGHLEHYLRQFKSQLARFVAEFELDVSLSQFYSYFWDDESPFYDAFMKHNGFYQMARQLLATQDFRKDATTRERALKEFRKAIKKGKLPQWMKEAFAAARAEFAADQSIRCRSSTNNEDLPGFSGAGLYDSFTHKPDEGELGKSIRQVYASMWNFRAFEEREFFRIDHMQAAMGVVLHKNTKGERVTGGAVSKDVLYQAQHKDMTLYYVNAQRGEDLVTNPNAASVPEELLLSPRNSRNDRVLQYSNRIANQESLLDPECRQELRQTMRIISDRFARLYEKVDDADFAMEVEFKVDAKGNVLVKQARPWIE